MYSTRLSPSFGFGSTRPFRLVWLGVALLALAVTTAITSQAQTFSVLYNLGATPSDPANPQYEGILVQGRDGDIYSTSQSSFYTSCFCGTVFKITPSGTITDLFDFNWAAGSPFYPRSGLTLGVDGNYYGTTSSGGTFNFGTVFKFTGGGTMTPLYMFGTAKYPKVEGSLPLSPPVQGRDGNFYGTTPDSNDGVNDGIAYRITPAGAFTKLYLFNYGNSTGYNPQAGLILGKDGNFYGTTALGGKNLSKPCYGGSAYSCGSIFRMTPSGKITFLHYFDEIDGAGPLGPLVQGTDGNFYGTTVAGGDTNGDGVIFKLTPQGTFAVLHSFDGNDGKQTTAGLVQASDGSFYGVSSAGGTKGFGTLFKITPTGVFTVLHEFSSTDGTNPEVTLLQHTDGVLYGETYSGGKFGRGTIFTWNGGSLLHPFVAPLPNFGKIGTSIGILGKGFTGTTAVSFNGSAAKFAFVSDTYLTATIPTTTATGGVVSVTTPTGVLNSEKSFIVLPSITSFTPTSGKVGTSVVITGGGLNGATQVTFGGVKATGFTANFSWKVTATVPLGAITGRIAIATPWGTATTAGPFTVTP
jgi:uncharacterized repeat protein (TIGR03803 family)